MTLTERIVRYLSLHDGWVSKSLVQQLSAQHGYSQSVISASCLELESLPRIGTLYVGSGDRYAKLPVGSYYRWYDIPERDLRYMAHASAFFEEL